MLGWRLFLAPWVEALPPVPTPQRLPARHCRTGVVPRDGQQPATPRAGWVLCLARHREIVSQSQLRSTSGWERRAAAAPLSCVALAASQGCPGPSPGTGGMGQGVASAPSEEGEEEMEASSLGQITDTAVNYHLLRDAPSVSC